MKVPAPPASHGAFEWGGTVLAPAKGLTSRVPRKMSSNLFLADGATVVVRALTQFGDTADGFTANLTVYFPVTCPDEVLDHYLRHYAVEIPNWIAAAATPAPEAPAGRKGPASGTWKPEQKVHDVDHSPAARAKQSEDGDVWKPRCGADDR
ncbi:hypothetical protein [Streptomyces sp. NPDC091268]|uniref:hypothetical protein n=1 Tax=Streptomyces sp. NPDC091268 TaxID=3365979 RepID=UPI00381E4E78